MRLPNAAVVVLMALVVKVDSSTTRARTMARTMIGLADTTATRGSIVAPGAPLLGLPEATRRGESPSVDFSTANHLLVTRPTAGAVRTSATGLPLQEPMLLVLLGVGLSAAGFGARRLQGRRLLVRLEETGVGPRPVASNWNERAFGGASHRPHKASAVAHESAQFAKGSEVDRRAFESTPQHASVVDRP